MKKSLKLISIFLFVGSLVVGCSNNNNPQQSSSSKPEEKNYEGRIKSAEFTVLDLTNGITNVDDPRYYEESKPVDAYKSQDKIKFYYLDEINDVYYVTLDEFAKVFKDDLAEGITSSNSEENGVSTWTLKQNNNDIYKMSVDPKKQTISVNSGTEDTLVKAIYNGRTGLFDGAQLVTEYVDGHPNTTRVYNFAKYDFDFFEVEGKYAYPFALLLAETSKVMDRSFLYLSSYQQLLKYGMYEQLQNTNFLIDGSETTVENYAFGAFLAKYPKPDDPGLCEMPASLAAFNKKLFYYIMDNSYGLAKEKGIKSMSDYFENFKESELFLSTDSVIRGSAYNRAMLMLNDQHSGYSYSKCFKETGGDGIAIYSQTINADRVNLSTLLSSMRNEALDKYAAAHGLEDIKAGELRLSTDQKTAYFSFDSFLTFNYFDQGDIPEDKLLEDAYYLFVARLNEAKSKGVKNVVIDDSLNGGGYVNIMGKLLALMSKDNKSEIFLKCDDNGAIERYTTRVDSNKDGVYDVKDCFGNDFSFYVVTSNYSFSCGNAFPFYVAQNNLGKIIGQKSGGGECCVFSYSFPTGQGIGYSSPYHLGYYNPADDSYKADEYGAYPNISIGSSFYDIYDVDKVAAKINATYPSEQ